MKKSKTELPWSYADFSDVFKKKTIDELPSLLCEAYKEVSLLNRQS